MRSLRRAAPILAALAVGCSSAPSPDLPEAGVRPDASVPDAGPPADSGADADGGAPCDEALPAFTEPPRRLSEAGLFADLAADEVVATARPYAPRFPLWSDGATKRRWIQLPTCAGRIDNIDMDDWRLPVGARAFKEFSIDGDRIETRLVYKHGPDPDDVMFATYLWNEAQTEAHWVDPETTAPEELERIRGHDYDVPHPDRCVDCHGQVGGGGGGLRSRLLGFSAVQLAHDGDGVTVAKLSDEGRLARPWTEPIPVPGDAITRAALGYLHSNCGPCHNEGPDAVDFPNHPFSLRLRVGERAPADTGAYRTAVGAEMRGFFAGCGFRAELGAPGDSCVLQRMLVRDGATGQMPPLGTHRVDPAGIDKVRAWLERAR